jgi:hypothetical protein
LAASLCYPCSSCSNSFHSMKSMMRTIAPRDMSTVTS